MIYQKKQGSRRRFSIYKELLVHLDNYKNYYAYVCKLIFNYTVKWMNSWLNNDLFLELQCNSLIESFNNGKETTEYECLNAEHDDGMHLRLVESTRCTVLIVQVPTENFRYELYFLLRRWNRLQYNVLEKYEGIK